MRYLTHWRFVTVSHSTRYDEANAAEALTHWRFETASHSTNYDEANAAAAQLQSDALICRIHAYGYPKFLGVLVSAMTFQGTHKSQKSLHHPTLQQITARLFSGLFFWSVFYSNRAATLRTKATDMDVLPGSSTIHRGVGPSLQTIHRGVGPSVQTRLTTCIPHTDFT